MKTKWAILALFVLGVVAALTAAVLVASLAASGKTAQAVNPSADVRQIVVANKALTANTMISNADVTVKTVRKEDAPAQAVSGTDRVLGKVLAVAMVQDQPFTEGCFVSNEGSGQQMAATLTNGMRAVTISLSEQSGLQNLLYPGCYVDVLASGSEPGKDVMAPELFSVPLLQYVQVLAVDDQTLFTPEERRRPVVSVPQRGGQMLVTLMVSPDQARFLQLASQRGTLSLSLRNPKDRDRVDDRAIYLGDLVSSYRHARTVVEATPAPDKPLVISVKPLPPPAPPKKQVTIIRGGAVTQEAFEQSEHEAGTAD